MRIRYWSSDVCSSDLIDIPGQVFVRGRGLESEWGGALTVTGRADDPKVEGAIEVRRGRFDGLGRSFAFERGRGVFDGGPASDPPLDMILATAGAEIAATGVERGQAQSAKIKIGRSRRRGRGRR